MHLYVVRLAAFIHLESQATERNSKRSSRYLQLHVIHRTYSRKLHLNCPLGCSQLERRFLCSLLSSKNKECSPELAKKVMHYKMKSVQFKDMQ